MKHLLISSILSLWALINHVKSTKFNPHHQNKHHTNVGTKSIDNSGFDAIDNEKLMVIMDDDCIDNLTPEERSNLITTLFPCLTKKSNHSLVKSLKGKSSILFLEIIDDSCLDDNDNTTNLDDFCIESIFNEPIFMPIQIDGNCQTQDVSSNNLPSEYSWALDHFDQKNDQLYNYFQYNGNNGNVDIYIIDSGVSDQHEEFSNNQIFHMLGDGPDTYVASNGQTWFTSHGTHVASIAAGM